MAPASTPSYRHPIYYDRVRHRLWICGQRLHHGATGAVLTLIALGLMVHDWKDRSHWFQRGWQDWDIET